MSPLPERRKTAEELAELRKSLGIPGAAAKQGEAVEPGDPDGAGDVGEAGGAGSEPAPAESGKEPSPAADGGAADAAAEAVVLKPVRSLKRSERAAPIHLPKPAAEESGKIPAHRHSERELMELRMKEAHSESPAVHLDQLHVGHLKIIAIYLASCVGYGLVFLAGWASTVPTPDLPARWIADFVHRPDLGQILAVVLGVIGGLVLLLSGWIWWKKPRSRHHAAFLTIIAVLVLVFGILHLLPDSHAA